MNLHYNTVSENMLIVLKQLIAIKELEPFRLVGGTALALQFGHRISVDLDLFAGGRVDISSLISAIDKYFKKDFRVTRRLQHGISCVINNIKVDLFDWKIPYAHDALIMEGIRMANPQDIFANKCEAVLGRRAEKDLCDIAEILKHYELNELIKTLKTRYPFITPGSVFAILLKSETIERDTTIRFLQGNTFENYAALIGEKISAYQQKLQDQKKLKEEERAGRIQALIEKKRSGK